MSNSGFVDIVTAPVTAAPATFPNLGRFAPLTGPTIAPDGTVILGTLDGKVIALHPDGRPFWDSQLPDPQTILTPPVVGSDGSVYVLGSWVARDHRGGVTRRIGFAALHRFTREGAIHPATAFPGYGNGPTIIGAPSGWQYQGEEAIIVPATFPGVGAPDQYLLAFSPDGGVIAEWKQTLTGGDVEADEAESWGALIPHVDFEPGYFVPPAYPPVPGVSIATNPQGGTPLIVFVDRYFRRTVTFSLCVGPSCSPAPGFQELIQRSHSPHTLWSSGTLAPDTNHTVIGTDDGVVFGGPSGSILAPVTGLGEIYATPTVTVDGRIVAVTMFGEVVGLRGGAIVSRVQLPGATIARPAASRNYVYVSTTEGLHTLDAEADATVATFPLEGAGIWSPVIGPERHVYVIAANVLHIFPPLQTLPRQPRGQGIGRAGDGPVVG